MSSVTLKDMENEVRFMSGSWTNDISISNELGNIIELNDINDTLGLDMISNPKMMSSNNEPSRMNSLAEVEVKNLNTIEPVTIDLSEPSFPPFQAEIKKEDNNIFLNNQSSSSASISLDQPQSRNTEADKKEKMEYLNKLQRLEQKGYPVSRRYT